MTKDVLLTVSGLHYETFSDEVNQENDAIEVVTPGTYYYKNGKHYVLYDEVVEGMLGTIKNKVRLSEDGVLEIIKNGLSQTHMVFEKDKINMTQYNTPYGELLVGVYTTDMKVSVTDTDIDVKVHYALDVNSEKVADCDICMNIHANGEQ